MKKCIAILLSTLLLLAACGAVAETVPNVTDHYIFSGATPEGYGVIEDHREFNSLIVYSSEDETKPEYTLSIAYSELFDGLSVADLSEEEINFYKGLVASNYNDVNISDAKTEVGTQLFVFNETDSASDYVTIATIYEGYVLEMHIDKADFSEISQEDIDVGVKIFSDIAFLR